MKIKAQAFAAVFLLLFVAGIAAADLPPAATATYAVQFDLEETTSAGPAGKVAPRTLVIENESASLEVSEGARRYSLVFRLQGGHADKRRMYLQLDREERQQKMKLSTSAELPMGERQLVATLAGAEGTQLKVYARIDRR